MSTPAGWYDDGTGRQRWYDGAQWTDVYSEPKGAQPPHVPAAPPTAGTSKSSGGTVLGGLALGIGIGSFFFAWLPLLGGFLALAAIALGIIALVRGATAVGRGLAITGLVIGSVAAIIALFWNLLFLGATATSGPTQESGSFEQPIPFGTTVLIDDGAVEYRITLGELEWDPEGAASPMGDYRYVVIPMTIENLDSSDLNPYLEMSFNLDFVGADGRTNAFDSAYGQVPGIWGALDTIPATATADGVMIYRVPADATDGVWLLRGVYIDATP